MSDQHHLVLLFLHWHLQVLNLSSPDKICCPESTVETQTWLLFTTIFRTYST